MKKSLCIIFASFAVVLFPLLAFPPQVSDISHTQRVDAEGNLTKLVDIQYNLDGNRSMFVEFFFSPDGGDTFPVVCTAVTGDAGPGVEYGVGKTAVWDASVDWNQNFTDRGRIMVKATYGDQPTGFPGLDINGSHYLPLPSDTDPVSPQTYPDKTPRSE